MFGYYHITIIIIIATIIIIIRDKEQQKGFIVTCFNFHGIRSLTNTRNPELDTLGSLNFRSCVDRKRQRKTKMMKHQNVNVSIRRALNYGNTVTIKFKKLYVTLLSCLHIGDDWKIYFAVS